MGEVQDVPGIITSKANLKYAGPNMDAMRAVAKAYRNRSLQDFQVDLLADWVVGVLFIVGMHQLSHLLFPSVCSITITSLIGTFHSASGGPAHFSGAS
jgi:hypothetical protein